MEERMQEWMRDIQIAMTELQGDIVWLAALVEHLDGEERLHNMRRVRDYICSNAQGLMLSVRTLVMEQERVTEG